MKRTALILALAFAAAHSPACDDPNCPSKQAKRTAAAPAVSNVQFTQIPDTTNGGTVVVITYDLASPNGASTVHLRVSDDGGDSFRVAPQSITGHVGAGVAAGTAREIRWRVGDEMPNERITQARFRVVADDGTCTGCMLWSDPATWGGVKPVAGQNVTIPMGWHVILDEDTPDLGGLTIEGTLEFAREDLHLTADYIAVHGELKVGDPFLPFEHQATITLNDMNPLADIGGMGTRGILVMDGGTLSLHGLPPATPWTKVNDHVPAASSGMTPEIALAEEVDWRAGDQLVIAPTDFHTVNPTAQLGITEALTLAQDAAGDALTVTALPQRARWGRLQYATTTGMSLTPPAPGSPEEIVLGPGMENTPLVLDQRAAIGNLTRNIVIEAPNDPLWTTNGFGVHVMVMGEGSAAYVDGVEIRRGGQHFALGRYPFHWHMLSYDPPTTLADATGQYFRNSVINQSRNRGIVVHGTNGVLVKDNIVYDVRGHGVFTEDAVERRNTFDGNLVLRVRNPTQALKLHETEFGSPGVQVGSSGFWISNPDNTVTDNLAADCEGMGFWLAFTFQAWGASTGVPINPQRLPLEEFARNTAHSNRYRGVLIDISEGDPDGRVGIGPQQYIPTSDPNGDGLGAGAAYENRIPFELTDLAVWKNGHNGIWDRASGPKNRRIVSADNALKFFAGSGEEGLIENCLAVGDSLNNASPRPTQAGDPAPSAFATYHSAFDMQRNIVMNFPLYPGQTSGAFAEDDFYFRPVEKGTVRHAGNIIINSHPGYKSRPLLAGQLSTWVLYPVTAPGQFYQFPPFASWFTFAQAKWDPHGWAGPAGNYVVYNDPFFTHELAVTPIAPDTAATPPAQLGEAPGAVSVPGPFYGFTAFTLHGHGPTPPQNFDFADLMAIEVRRYDPDDMSLVATWSVAGICCPDAFLAHMRDFAAHPNGVYELDFPWNEWNPGWGQAPQYRYPTNFRMEVENMLTADDTLVMGIEFSGAINARVLMQPTSSEDGGGNPAAVTLFTPALDIDDLIASEGFTFWQDETNNRVWVKLRGGAWAGNGTAFAPDSDQLIYETTYLRIEPAP